MILFRSVQMIFKLSNFQCSFSTDRRTQKRQKNVYRIFFRDCKNKTYQKNVFKTFHAREFLSLLLLRSRYCQIWRKLTIALSWASAWSCLNNEYILVQRTYINSCKRAVWYFYIESVPREQNKKMKGREVDGEKEQCVKYEYA